MSLSPPSTPVFGTIANGHDSTSDAALAARRKAFRALHERGCFVIPNPWDIGTAKMLEAWGAKALATTSAGFAFTLGKPDGDNIVSRDVTLANFGAIAAATDLPVSADLQGCFGRDPKVVAETIRLAGAAGLCGGSVEDASGDILDIVYQGRRGVLVPFTRAAVPTVDVAGGYVLIDTLAAGLGVDPDEAEARAATDDGS